MEYIGFGSIPAPLLKDITKPKEPIHTQDNRPFSWRIHRYQHPTEPFSTFLASPDHCSAFLALPSSLQASPPPPHCPSSPTPVVHTPNSGQSPQHIQLSSSHPRPHSTFPEHCRTHPSHREPVVRLPAPSQPLLLVAPPVDRNRPHNRSTNLSDASCTTSGCPRVQLTPAEHATTLPISSQLRPSPPPTSRVGRNNRAPA